MYLVLALLKVAPVKLTINEYTMMKIMSNIRR